MRTADSTIPIALGLDGTSALEAILDTRGFRHARISCMANTEVALDATDGANRLLESDDGVTFSEIAASVAGSSFVPASSLPQTNVPRLVYDLDLRGRKRFIKVQYQTAETTQPFIVADFAMPISSATTGVEVFDGEFGSSRAGSFIRDAIAGRDSVDIVVCGDSNSAFNGGYSRAWNSQMVAHGATLYGTGLYPAAQGGSIGAAIGSHTTVGIAAFPGRYTGQTSGVAWLAAGSGAGFSAIDDVWNKNAGAMRPYSGTGTGDYGVEWMYYGTGTNDSTTNFSIEIQAACPTPPAENWVARTGYVTFATGSGYFVNRWTIDASPYTTLAAEKFLTNTGTLGYAVAETEIGANPGRTGDIKCSPYNAGGSGGTLYPDSVSAPAGFLFFSAFVRRKGFAVTQIQNYGGATTTQLVDGITGAGGTLTTYLRELRERQISGGGTGRVVIWLNSGTNGGPAAPSNWSEGATDLRDDVLARWISLGYPTQDLAFLFSVTHPKVDPDDMAATRSEARSWVVGKDDSTVVDIAVMADYARLDALTLLDDAGSQHLEEVGYSYVVKRIIATIATGELDAQIVKL
jgi:hypothetical protein